MRKILITFLYVFIFLSLNFTNININTYDKIKTTDKKSLVENTQESIVVENQNDTADEPEKQEVEVKKVNTVSTNNEQSEVKTENINVIQTSTTNETTQSNNQNSVTYGTFGRLYISGFSVALYDYNVNTHSNLSLQEIVDNRDSAAYYRTKGKLVIADHNTQGFSILTNISEGTTAYIKLEDGSTISYRLIKKSKGYNTGPDLVDTENNSFFNMESDIIMYTCYDGGIMATLWVLS